MKKFLLNVAGFTAILFCIAAVADCYQSRQLRQSKDRLYAGWNNIYNDTTAYDLVINGSSRAWVQYDPHILDSVLHINSYNLGIDGSCINRQVVKYHKYCERHGQPHYLIQNIDWFTLDVRTGYERNQFFPYFFSDRKLMREMDRYEHFSFFEKYIPYYRYIGMKPSPYIEEITKGYRGRDYTWDGTEFEKQDNNPLSADTDMIHLFSSFLSEQKAAGTQVLLVYSPAYHGIMDIFPEADRMYFLFDSIVALYDIPILNYLEEPLCYDTAYFYNAMHLNRTGAELFTTQLAHDIDSIGFIR